MARGCLCQHLKTARPFCSGVTQYLGQAKQMGGKEPAANSSSQHPPGGGSRMSSRRGEGGTTVCPFPLHKKALAMARRGDSHAAPLHSKATIWIHGVAFAQQGCA
eukprot:GGOE01009939.1.p2 GENE.GGOE01009939.1~~GGOE01009939.1.p2  ORF type:complete len:105 (+),score=1.70 GGOE01009939.1:242-556(+)